MAGKKCSKIDESSLATIEMKLTAETLTILDADNDERILERLIPVYAHVRTSFEGTVRTFWEQNSWNISRYIRCIWVLCFAHEY